MRNSPLRAFAKKDKKTHSTQSDEPRKWKSYYPNTPEQKKKNEEVDKKNEEKYDTKSWVKKPK